MENITTGEWRNLANLWKGVGNLHGFAPSSFLFQCVFLSLSQPSLRATRSSTETTSLVSCRFNTGSGGITSESKRVSFRRIISFLVIYLSYIFGNEKACITEYFNDRKMNNVGILLIGNV